MLPGAKLEELPRNHPVFHTVYDIPELVTKKIVTRAQYKKFRSHVIAKQEKAESK